MASPSPWRRWSWNTAKDSAINFSSSSSFNPSILFCSHANHSKRTSLTTFSLHDSSSPPSSSSIPSTSNAGKRLRKSVEIETFSSGEDSKSNTVGNNNTKIEVSADRIKSPKKKKRTLTFKSLFGRRSLWRRILFASKKVRSIILLNVITIVYASNIPVVKEVEAIMDPAAFTVVRFATSAIPFIPFVLRARDDVQTRNAGVELGFWVSLGYLTQALGLLTSDAGRASFISMLTVIIVPLLDGMLGAIVPARTWFGALMSILGVALLESSGSPPSVGDLLNFLSAVFFGIHMLRTEHISRSTNKENFLPLLGYEICVIALSSTMWYVVGGWFGGIQECNPSSLTWTMFWAWMVAFPWIPALYTGIFSTGLCLWIEMVAMRDVSATETAIVYGLEPVWGAGFAWFLLGERWGTPGWIGAALVLGGSLTVQIFGLSSPSESKEDEESSKKDDHLLVSNKQKGLSTSPVVISSRKDVTDLLKKLDLQTEIKSSPNRLFDIYKNKTSLMPKISPHKIQSIEVLEGDGRTVGSVRLWTYVLGGPVIAIDKIDAVEEENNSITFNIIGGEVTKYYKSFKATMQAAAAAATTTNTKDDMNLVKWSLEYEKANEDVPTPYSQLEFLLSVSREVDAYLLKA